MTTPNPSKTSLLLASQSPRRSELLRSLGYDFQVVSVYCDEVFPSSMPIEEVAEFLSLQKANAYHNLKPSEILLTADTIVCIDDEILGKPKDYHTAKAMLERLSGRSHRVHTGITLRTLEQTISQTDTAEVIFEEIKPHEIDYYLHQFQPFDKAGCYGIQEWIGMAKIREIKGSFYTIMGLPTQLIYKGLETLDFRISTP